MAERPGGLVVVGKLGVFGSEPLHFYGKLAYHLGADHHSPFAIHDELFSDKHRGSKSAARGVDREMLRRTQTSLEAGRSVVFDAFVNKPERRDQLMELAEGMSAVGVLVHTRANMKLVRQRITRRYETGKLPIPKEEATLETELRMAGGMMRYVQQPEVNPDRADVPHVCMSGALPINEMFSQIDAYILEHTPAAPDVHEAGE